MIVVTVELWSAISGAKTQLARMHICNDGEASTQNHRVGDYIGETFVGRDAASLAKGRVSKRASVHGWRRHDFHVWNLVRRMLEAMGYTKGASSALPLVDDSPDAQPTICRFCHGEGWEEDQNWAPRYADVPQERLQGDGLIRCGWCLGDGIDARAEALPDERSAQRLLAFNLLELLRRGEGASVTILCDNPEAASADVQSAIEVNDDWTGWQDRRFLGRDIPECLVKAAEAMAQQAEAK